MATFLSSLGAIFTNPTYLILMLVFVAIGILLGALPGINVIMALILALPLTYGMNTETAMVVLFACYTGAMSGGLISAITLNVPGTSSSIATTFDGFPMAKKGLAGRACGIGILTSFVGGTLSYILLIFVAPLMADLALKFGPWEYFAIGVFSITMIVTLSGDDIPKGLLASVLGMCLAMTGTDPIGNVVRYNFGNHALDGGVSMMAVMTGMFVVPEILKLASNLTETEAQITKVEKMRGYGITAREYLSKWKTILRAAAIGSYCGILPGVGGSSASLMAYMTEKNCSKHPETFGKGEVEGLIASETANNASLGGAVIPMLALGIPGSTAAAVIMGALTLHGVQCGPLVFSTHVDLVYLIFAILFVANVMMLVFERLILNGYIKILTAPRRIVMVVVMMLCFMGAYTASSNFTDVIIFVIFGTVGYFLEKGGIPRAPLILGYILTGIIEENFVRALSISGGSGMAIFSRPIALIFLAIAVFSLISQSRKQHKAAKKKKTEEQAEET